MKERGISFSGAMVLANNRGAKIQTRRLAKLPNVCPYGVPGDRLWVREAWRTPAGYDMHSGTELAERCTAAGYKKPWAPIRYEADGYRDNWIAGTVSRGEKPGRLRQARFMPRWASRTLLEIVEVRAQHLQDIDANDCLSEGVRIPVDAKNRVLIDISSKHAPSHYLKPGALRDPNACTTADLLRAHFASLWDSLNAERAPWSSNPLVLAISYRRVRNG